MIVSEKSIVSPTIFRNGPYRFYFFSREELRMHVHIQCSDGEAKFWLEPQPQHRVFTTRAAAPRRSPQRAVNRTHRNIKR
jgi:hypothetical protein